MHTSASLPRLSGNLWDALSAETATARPIIVGLPRPGAAVKSRWLVGALEAAAPSLLFGFRLWASVSLALYAAFWLQLDNPYWAGASAAIVCQPQLGASFRKGWFRILGTLVGTVASVVLIACFAQNRLLFLSSLALWGGACAFVATQLRNFASYAASLAGYTTAIIASELLGTVGGVDANSGFLLALTRATEICVGISCAGIVVAATDVGGARHRLAALFADLARDVAAGIAGTLSAAGSEVRDPRPAQRELVGRVISLDPIIDEAVGESSELRYNPLSLQAAVDGLLAALAGWSAVADQLVRLPADKARYEAAVILENLPPEPSAIQSSGASGQWIADPAAPRHRAEVAARCLTELPAATPSQRLLIDRTAQALAGIARALSGVALLVSVLAPPLTRGGDANLHVPDFLPALVSAGRTFAVISACALFWIVTGWPGGVLVMEFGAIVALLLAPRSDKTDGATLLFIVGAVLDVILTAIVAFAVLPALRSDDFAEFSLVLGGCLVPLGFLLRHARKPWQVGLFTAMTMGFVSILQPTNPETYDTQQFYNIALAIVAGMASAALSFRLIPPLSPALRARRLLVLTLRDLRRLVKGRARGDWVGLVTARLLAMPSEATPHQRAWILAAFEVGNEIIQLRNQPSLGAGLESALALLANGQSAAAVVRLSELDAMLSDWEVDGPKMQNVMRVRASMLIISTLLEKHAAYFDEGESG